MSALVSRAMPLAIDLFCGLGGWTEGFLAEGWRVVGFDNERHIYGAHRYPAQLVLQDVRTLHGSQFRHADAIVASSPCQEFSYRAMPWKRAKALPPPYFGMELFAQAARIQKEASEAAGRYIPMIQENVRGAQPWVGRADAHFGSYYLWGDVPALMPIPVKVVKAGKANDDAQLMQGWGQSDGIKVNGIVHRRNGASHTRHLTNPAEHVRQLEAEGRKIGGDRFSDPNSTCRRHGSKSKARKAASAAIAKIPFPLASYIARTFYDDIRRQAAA